MNIDPIIMNLGLIDVHLWVWVLCVIGIGIAAEQINPIVFKNTYDQFALPYRDLSPFQWARELVQNALEAGATIIKFTVAWPLLAMFKGYKLMVCDNGFAMSRDEMKLYFKHIGVSSKEVGTIHSNQARGARISLLPWNMFGLIIMSWKDGICSMAKMVWSETTKTFGLVERVWETEDGAFLRSDVYPPYVEENGFDWNSLKPDCITDHGTVVILLGNKPDQHTVLNDLSPHRGSHEKGPYKLLSYLNSRYATMEHEGRPFSISVDVLPGKPKTWPKEQPKTKKSKTFETHQVRGARACISAEKVREKGLGRVVHSGEEALKAADFLGTDSPVRYHWLLWEGARPSDPVNAYNAKRGCIYFLYKNELYDRATDMRTYRLFGVYEKAVAKNLFILVELPVDPKGEYGVYPHSDRSRLRLRGYEGNETDLPKSKIGELFGRNIPDPIQEAQDKANQFPKDMKPDLEWLKRYLNDNWEILKGAFSVSPKKNSGSGGRGSGGGGNRNRFPKPKAKTPEELLAERLEKWPGFKLVTVESLTDEEERKVLDPDGAINNFRPNVIATWMKFTGMYKNGCVILAHDHPFVKATTARFMQRYADRYRDEIKLMVPQLMALMLCAKVFHVRIQSEDNAAFGDTAQSEMFSDLGFTFALMGSYDVDLMLKQELDRRFKQSSDVDPDKDSDVDDQKPEPACAS